MEGIKFIKGRKVASYPDLDIYEGFPHNYYEVSRPLFSNEEQKVVDGMTDFIARKISYTELEKNLDKIDPEFSNKFRNKIVTIIESEEFLDKMPEPSLHHALKSDLLKLIKTYMPEIESATGAANYILDYSIGYGPLAIPMRDPHLEEIMVNGFEKNAFVLHKDFGMCKTNIIFREKNTFLTYLLNRIAKHAKRKFTATSPLLDARLPDGSRANATFPNVTPFGPTLTIRKFTYIPLSIVDLIEKKTMTSQLAAFLWLMIEGMNIEPKNIIFTGGTSSGKTTTLNACSAFISHRDRIVTIEDTIELNLGSRENWIQMEAKPKTKDIPEITMDELLQNSLRMRPDRILVGEVRGPEAQTMFVAMDTGHSGCLGTLHSNTAREMLIRLKNHPMSVPEQMLPLLDLIVVHYRMYDRELGLIRRIAQVAEISRMEEKVLLSNIFEWNHKSDSIYRTDTPSHVMQLLSDKTGLTKKALQNEMIVRQRMLEWMMENNIRSNPEVEKVIQEYYYSPNTVLEKIANETPKNKK